MRSGQSQSGCRAVTWGCESGWGGGFWRLEMRLGLVLGVWECLGGRVRAAVLGGEGGNPPPALEAIPWVEGGGGLPSSSLLPHRLPQSHPSCGLGFALRTVSAPKHTGRQSRRGGDVAECLVPGLVQHRQAPDGAKGTPSAQQHPQTWGGGGGGPNAMPPQTIRRNPGWGLIQSPVPVATGLQGKCCVSTTLLTRVTHDTRRGGGGGGTRPGWLDLSACGGAYWPLAFEPSAMTSRHPHYCGHPHCRTAALPHCRGGGGGASSQHPQPARRSITHLTPGHIHLGSGHVHACTTRVRGCVHANAFVRA